MGKLVGVSGCFSDGCEDPGKASASASHSFGFIPFIRDVRASGKFPVSIFSPSLSVSSVSRLASIPQVFLKSSGEEVPCSTFARRRHRVTDCDSS